ncbi:MAG: 16S rRNA (cytosine(967)-C(5))-methyltransferase [Burkholderiales bacterium RIFOXYC12_FULL_65_23]|uniref:16S rRNA (cytosine(967)-C(5))-methyltransferase RsmB n=1 Tax=Malikia spinosa TaxID=86180 RepID=UPI0008D84B28|nr:MAG: 16S rRNA (cytosine(967)-C(5))-methyltransferase [Burkholderiales bacterium RIFOXYC12_FULL_65_23]
MNSPIPLSDQLAAAARTLLAVEQGRSLTDVLAKTPARLRPGVQALAFHALRHWGEASVLIGLLAERPPEGAARALLGLALTLLLPQAVGGNVSYAAHTVVDQSVQALQQLKLPAGLAGFVNACLRRYLREQDELLLKAGEDLQARWNHPFWWVQRVRRDHPQHWQAILATNNRPAPMVLRVNRRRVGRDDYLQTLRAQGLLAEPVGRDGIALAQAVAVDRLPGWEQGHCSVQDLAAQLAAPLLLDGAQLPAGARVLDACAAPGGKTAHLLECAELDLLALDVDPQRCERIRDNLQRLGLKAELRAADAADTDRWWDGRAFDAILLDAPCTASGIVRRHPDVRWLRRPGDIAQLAAQQLRLLEALWPTLGAGGRLLYCTCSVFKAEGEQQVRDFLQRHPDAQLLPSPGHLMPGEALSGGSDGADNLVGMDGFFYALLLKRPAG